MVPPGRLEASILRGTLLRTVVCQAIAQLSRTLRAVSLCYDDGYCPPGPELEVLRRLGPVLAQALTSCLSLRFLQLGFPVLSMPVPQQFELLEPIPIECLYLSPDYMCSRDQSKSYSTLIDNLHLLPNLLVLMCSNWTYNDYDRLNSKFPRLAVGGPATNIWPPTYARLSPETQALFKYRPYRE
jgi:hypothetical protein